MSSNDKLLIKTQKDLFYPGDPAHGQILILLRRPIRCSGLTLDFYGEKKETSENGAYTKRFDEFSILLSEEKVFQDGEEFNFSLTIPNKITYQTSSGFLGLFKSGPKYFLHATLAMSGGGLLNCKKQLKIAKKE